MSSQQVIADSSTRVIAIANQKGGVGKTTTTVNLGAALAELGQRVLLIDLDPQANASTGLGINPRSIEKNMYDVLLGDTPLEDTLEPAADVEGLFVAPASLDLAGAEIELVPGFNRERRLVDALALIVDDYDYVFIDCPPSLGLLTINALVAATEVLVPIQCEYYALEGVGQLVRNVELVRKSLNPSLEISTIVLVMYDARTKLAGQVVDEVRSHFGDIVCRIVIPRVVRLSEAPSYGQPITVFDPTNRGAMAYRDLANEIQGNVLDLTEPIPKSPIAPGIGLNMSDPSPLNPDGEADVIDDFRDEVGKTEVETGETASALPAPLPTPAPSPIPAPLVTPATVAPAPVAEPTLGDEISIDLSDAAEGMQQAEKDESETADARPIDRVKEFVRSDEARGDQS